MSQLALGQTPSTLHKCAIPSRHHHRAWKRRRLKPLLTPRCSLSSPTPSPFENLLHALLSHLPSPNSIDYLAPTLGLASGLALFFSAPQNPKKLPEPSDFDVGEWILFTSPTPFNRFVTLRCPTICFPGNESVSEKLVKEDRHYVNLNRGRMVGKSSSGGESVVYQRVCVGADDGGVVAIDWPANLDLEEEHGLDTTVLIVPGTVEGSNERSIRVFVCECLRRGFFPVVVNPRGCAGSPLTTARLFTAADSDDVSTAIQFITKKRPWTTLMGVGWGYGANMLTKYLAESGERTPLTAATCIDNPFDLEEARRSSLHNTDFDERHLSGLISILQCNKELFQGRGRGFDVEKALSASSIRDFEEAISMVSQGFVTIEDFYANSSTRDVVGKVKIPVLFIQNNDGTVPLFSVPRSLIAENPYTSLLLYSYSSSSEILDGRLMFSWCQQLAIEWLTAVELGLLKGRHPLLKDVDVNINPSKGLALVEGTTSSKSESVETLLPITNGCSTTSPVEMFEADDTRRSISRSRKSIGPSSVTRGLQQVDNGIGQQSIAAIDSVEEEGMDSFDNEQGQVVQSAIVVMNMLDVTMPETLSDEQKKKVLEAVGRGETLIKALQDAVPEDVRGKLTSAVSGILQNQGSNLIFDKFLRLVRIPDLASGSNSKVIEKIRVPKANGEEDIHSPDRKRKSNDPVDDSSKVGSSSDKSPREMELEKQSSDISQKPCDTGVELEKQLSHTSEKSIDAGVELEKQSSDISQKSSDTGVEFEKQSSHTSEKSNDAGIELEKQSSDLSQKPNDIGISQSTSNLGGNNLELEKANLNHTVNSLEKEQVSGGSPPEASDRENVSEINGSQEFFGQSEGPGGAEDVATGQKKVERESGKGQSDPREENNHNQNNFLTDKNRGSEESHAEDKSCTPAPNSENESTENETESKLKKEEKVPVSLSNQTSDVPPSFSVSQALDALTGFDDSTQVAVNSVFHVIEDMIDHLDGEKDNEDNINEVNGADKVKKLSEGPLSEIHHVNNDQPVSEIHHGNNDHESLRRDNLSSNGSSNNCHSDGVLLSDPASSGFENNQQHYAFDGYSTNSSDISNNNSRFQTEDESSAISAGNFAKLLYSSPEKISSYLTISPYGDPLYKEYLKTYLHSKMQSTGNLDMGKSSALYLNYVPEEGQWKLIEQSETNGVPVDDYLTGGAGYREEKTGIPRSENSDNIIEPSYVILDAGNSSGHDNIEFGDAKSGDPILSIKSIILERLNVEVCRKASAADMEELELQLSRDVEHVANAVAIAAGHGNLHMVKDSENQLEKLGVLDGEEIVKDISSAVQETQRLRRLLPIGVIVGASLAELRKLFDVATLDGYDGQNVVLDQVDKSTERLLPIVNEDGTEKLLKKTDDKEYVNYSDGEDKDSINDEGSGNNGVMVGAVTAALGASAFIVHQQNTEIEGTQNEPLKEKESGKEPSKLDEMLEKPQNNIVASLAEKAMSVASPVVPTKEDGGLDHERLVDMLSELGQKGGILKLVAKVALLWGGIRGAMSLADKLISFLRIAERPLCQRTLGFVLMVLLLWSPVVVPLLPSLMQSWATHNPLKIAEFAGIVGLYASTMIMITLWGKRIRKYDNPLLQYGLDFSSFTKNFLKGLVGGIVLVVLIHSVNSSIGCVRLCWPTTLPLSFSEPIAFIKSYGKMFLLILQGIATAAGVSVLEELLFRSWLPQEIAVDLGYHRGIIISGLAFALSQRSTWEIPGLWLISLSLSGARQRSQGSLSLPIGIRTGILASNFILKTGGFLTYQPSFPLWITGSHPFQPFSGVVGLAFSLILAVILYPREPLHRRKTTRVIRD